MAIAAVGGLQANVMTENHCCLHCGLPCVEIDAHGERLRGCLGCNRWQALVTREWRQLPEDEVAALRGMGSSQRWQRMS
jgi:hypothetical protein